MWIDSQTEEEIMRGIREAKLWTEYDNLSDSAYLRAKEDYLMGINFSRAMSVKYGNLLNDAAGTQSYTAIAVGRVMTCVLGMVVIREREIRNFVETPFYRVIGSFTDHNISAEWKAVEGSKYFESPLLYKENGFKKEESAKQLMDELSGKRLLSNPLKKVFQRKERLFFLTWQSYRRSVQSVLKSVRMKPYRWHRIYMKRSLRHIRERMPVYYLRQ